MYDASAPSTTARRSIFKQPRDGRLGPVRRRHRDDRPRLAHDVAPHRPQAPDVRRRRWPPSTATPSRRSTAARTTSWAASRPSCRRAPLFFVMSDHGFHSFRRGVNLNTWLVQNGYMVFEGQESREEDAGRPVRPRQVLGRRRLEPARAPTRWASARSTSTCAAARGRASSPRARSTRRCRTRSRPSSCSSTDPDTGRAGDARRLQARRHLQGRIPAVRARPAGGLQRRLPRGLAGHAGRRSSARWSRTTTASGAATIAPPPPRSAAASSSRNRKIANRRRRTSWTWPPPS